jgi:hypothetical protein
MVLGCEDFIQSTLKSPSSYKRVSVSEDEEPITTDELKQSGSVLFQLSAMHSVPIPTRVHTVLIQYDADNSYGASIRSAAVCAFDVGDNPTKQNVNTGVSMAKSAAHRRSWIEQGLLPNNGKTQMDPPYPCCLM